MGHLNTTLRQAIRRASVIAEACLDRVERGLRAVSYGAAAVGGAVLLVMLCAVAANIALRPFIGGVRGALEISGYLCALAVGLCMPVAQIAGSHIASGIWADTLPRRGRWLQETAGSVLCAFLLAVAARELLGIAAYADDMGEYIEGFNFSYSFMAAGFAFGAALHAAIFLHAALRALLPATGAKGEI